MWQYFDNESEATRHASDICVDPTSKGFPWMRLRRSDRRHQHGVGKRSSAGTANSECNRWLVGSDMAVRRGLCPSNEDHFDLELRTDGNQVCAKLAASANGGNKVDEDDDGEPPSVAGRYEVGAVTVAYLSHWGGRGVASIRIEGGELQWHVLWHDKGTSYIPQQAVLHKITEPKRPLWQDFDCPL